MTEPDRSTAYLLAEIAELRLAIPVASIETIVGAVACTAVPSAPAVVLGLASLHGRPVAVVDLRRRWALPELPLRPDQHLVIATAGRRLLGLLVDRALRLVDLEPAAVRSAPEILPGARRVTGVATVDGTLWVIVAPEKLVDPDEEAAWDRALGALATADEVS